MEISAEMRTKLNDHVGMHVDKYPATCSDLVMACNNLHEFSAEEKEWFSKTLPHGTFQSPEEVRKAVGI